MRLSHHEISSIRSAVLAFDSIAKIYLFGSRAKDSAKGGDIDLLIESFIIGYTEKRKIRTQIKKLIGDQKIDILIMKDLNSCEDPFILKIFREAIPI